MNSPDKFASSPVTPEIDRDPNLTDDVSESEAGRDLISPSNVARVAGKEIDEVESREDSDQVFFEPLPDPASSALNASMASRRSATPKAFGSSALSNHLSETRHGSLLDEPFRLGRASSSNSNAGAEDERKATLALALTPGVGSITFHRLVETFGSASATLRASSARLREVLRVGPSLVSAIVQQRRCWESLADEIDVACCEDGQQWITYHDASYPATLHNIADPPPILFLKGNLAPLQTLGVAIVGTRHASRYGIKQAQRFAAELCARQVTVTSGLARGIDAAAHQSTLDHAGYTIAVLGGGLDKVHPRQNQTLAQAIMNTGLLMSEHPPGFPPRGGVFPQRNRVIAGMSLAVIVVEAGKRSGALITARHAVEQNREVFALPGPVDSPVSRGCHQLIRDGAGLIESIDDLWPSIGPLLQPLADHTGRVIHHAAEMTLNPQERAIVDAVGREGTLIDQLAGDTGLPISRVMATISALETRGILRRMGGAKVTLVG